MDDLLRPELLLEPDDRSSRLTHRHLIVVTNSRALALALGLATGLGIAALRPTTASKVADVLEALKDFPVVEPTVIVLDSTLQIADLGPMAARGGVELLKHLRLTPSLGAISLCPVVVALSGSIDNVIRASTDNVIVLSPATYPIVTPIKLPILLSLVAQASGFTSDAELHARLGDYVVYGPADEANRTHDYRNKAGVFHFISEFAGHLLPPEHSSLRSQRRELLGSLWVKKRDFLNDLSGSRHSATAAVGSLLALTHERQFLLIDDDHKAGWCTGLYAGLFGRVAADDQLHTSSSLAPLHCIETQAEALQYLTAVDDEWRAWLSRWSSAEHSYRQAARTLRRSADALDYAYDLLEKARKLATSDTAPLNRGGNRHDQSPEASAPCRVALGEAAPQLELLRKRLDVRSRQDLNEIAVSGQDQPTFLTGAPSLAEAKRRHHEIDQHHKETKSAAQEAAKVLKELSATRDRVLPHDLVFLDLRLGSNESDLDTSGLDGLTVLRRIRSIDPSLPIIVFSASNAIASYRVAMNSGATGYWVKGFSSGSDLALLVKSLLTQSQLRQIWLDIRRVESKTNLWRVTTSDTAPSEREPIKESEREQIHSFLRIAFDLLHATWDCAGTPEGVRAEYYHDVIRLMGIAQELRYRRRARDDDWWSRNRRILKQDYVLRKLRNDVSHPDRRGTKITRTQAMRALELTIRWLLQEQASDLVWQLRTKAHQTKAPNPVRSISNS